jgi:hypothetical protein
MSSDAHQSLLLWVTRKMAADGFLIAACDGPVPQGGVWNQLPFAPDFGGVRPDAVGIGKEGREFALGEAKTTDDIDTSHTRKQLCIFADLLRGSPSPRSRVYIAVPRSAASTLDRVLCRTALGSDNHVVRLYIPDCFIRDESHDHR